jgi:DNA-binding response OmpR family regulator
VALDIPARADAQALHTAVGRLRRLLRRHGLDAHLQTLHGSGYRWTGMPG